MRRTRAELAAGVDALEKRRCSSCRKRLDKNLFARCRFHGRQRRCRECHRKYMRQYRAAGYAAIETARYQDDPVVQEKVNYPEEDPEHASKLEAICKKH